MFDKHRNLAIAIAAAVVLVSGMMMLRGYIAEREQLAGMKAQLEAGKQYQSLLERSIEAERKQQSAIEETRAADVAKIEQLKQRVRSVEQVAAELPKAIAGLRPTVEKDGAAPDAPSALKLTAADSKVLFDFAQSCKQCEVNLGAAAQTLDSKDRQLKARDEQIAGLEKDLAVAVNAAKGGSKMRRFGRFLKTSACAGGGAAAGAAGSGAKGAAIGAVGAVVLCEMF